MNRYQRQEYRGSPLAPQNTPFQRHLYRGRSLVALISGYIISWLLIFADPSFWHSMEQQTSTLSPGLPGTLGMLGLFCVVVVVLIIDWRGLTTINGWLKWGRMKMWQKIVVGYFFIGFSILAVGVYFVQVGQTYFSNKRDEPRQLRWKIAEQEASLGMLPPTDGTCRVCHKPLQLGAEFCMYCGATVIEHPRICPNCSTTTLPDAKWCPKCRTRLDVMM